MENTVYDRIAQHIDENAEGAPKSKGTYSKAFIEYLKLLYTPEEANLVQYLSSPHEILPSTLDPENYLTAGQIAALSGVNIYEVKRILEGVAQRGAIASTGSMMRGSPIESMRRLTQVVRMFLKAAGLKGTLKSLSSIVKRTFTDIINYKLFTRSGFDMAMYALPYMPLLVNAHHFYEDLRPDDLQAAALYQQFFIKEGFYKYYESSEEGTPVMKVVPVETTIHPRQRILNLEEAHKIIDASVNVALTPCPCRTRTEKLGIRECKARNPVGCCIMLGFSSIFFESSGLGRKVTKDEAKQYLDQMQKAGLVATTDNWDYSPHSIICLCCECCCSQVRGRTRWENPSSLRPSNFIPQSDANCIACGQCVKRCFFGALSVDVELKRSIVDENKCIGCGVCTITCKQKSLRLIRLERSESIPTSRALYDRVLAENKKLK